MIDKFMPEAKVSRQQMIELVESVAERILREMNKKKEEREMNITEEHEAAFTIGKTIVELYGDVSYAHLIPLHSMNVDLRHLNLVTISPGQLKKFFNQRPDKFVPAHRCVIAAKNKDFLSRMMRSTEEMDAESVYEAKRIFDDSNLPIDMREKFRTIIDERIETGKSKTANIKNAEELFNT